MRHHSKRIRSPTVTDPDRRWRARQAASLENIANKLDSGPDVSLGLRTDVLNLCRKEQRYNLNLLKKLQQRLHGAGVKFAEAKKAIRAIKKVTAKTSAAVVRIFDACSLVTS